MEKEKNKKAGIKLKITGKDWMAWVVLAAVLFGLLILNIFYGDYWLDSDMAAEMIFSRLLWDNGEFFATGSWCYSTEFRVLYTQLIMEPLFFLFDSWHVIRVITNFITYLMLLISYFYMMKPFRVKMKIQILTAVILLLPFSETFITHVQFGNTYMPHMIIIFFGFGLFLRLADGKGGWKIRNIIHLSCYVLLNIICGLSGVRYMLTLQVPLVLTAVVYVMRSGEFAGFRRKMNAMNTKKLFGDERLGYLASSLTGMLSALIGYVLNIVVIAVKYDFQTYEETNFISVYQGIFLERLRDTLGSLLMLFGYIPDKGFLSIRGLITLLAFGMLAGIVFLLVRSGRLFKAEREKKGEFSHRRFLRCFLITAFLLNTFVFVFTTGTIVPRYYLTVFIFVVPLLAVYFEEEKLAFDRKAAVFILSFSLLFATAKSVFSFITTDKNADKRKVSAFLVEAGYEFGYATYWNANIVQEMTDGRVELANINKIEELSFFEWSSPKRYYDENYYAGEVFLLLTVQEAKVHKRESLIAEAEIVYEDEYYQVLHFDSSAELFRYR